MNDAQLLLGNQICFPVYSASRLITKAYKPLLDEIGLTYPQYLVLMVLWEKDEQTVNQLKEKLMLNTNTLSPMLKRMERHGLLQRIRSNQDERSVILQLTDSGKQLKLQALPIPEKLIKEILSHNIPLEDMLKLKEILSDLIAVLGPNYQASSSTKE